MSLSSDNSRMLIAIVSSILIHISIAVLGGYQLGKTSSKINHLSVKIINNTNSIKQHLVKQSTKQTSKLPVAESVTTASKTPIVDKIITPAVVKNTVADKQKLQTSKNKPAEPIIHKNIVAFAMTTQTYNKESTLTLNNKQLDKEIDNISLSSIKVAKHTSSTIKQQLAKSATKQPPKLSVAESVTTASKTPIVDKKIVSTVVKSKATSGQEIKTFTSKSTGKMSEKGLVKTNIPMVSAIPLYHLINKPIYPERSRDLGEEGTVIITIKVSKKGNVIKAYISKTSGYTLLDGSALLSVKSQWHFRPARQKGKSVESWIRVPIKFSISNN